MLTPCLEVKPFTIDKVVDNYIKSDNDATKTYDKLRLRRLIVMRMGLGIGRKIRRKLDSSLTSSSITAIHPLH